MSAVTNLPYTLLENMGSAHLEKNKHSQMLLLTNDDININSLKTCNDVCSMILFFSG